MSSNPEEIVAAIHKYFMVPQLIVFMTAETDALTSEVQKQFYDRLCPIEDKVKQERMSMKQTRDYLSKILPTDNRITMPSWKKKEYMELFPYFVTFGKQDMLPVLKKQYPELVSKNSEFYRFLNLAEYEKKEFWRTPKEFIFMMIANRTKCYLSITGSKYHLMEPDSLRNMYILFYLLYGMHNIVEEYENRREEGNEYYIHRAENRKQLFDYIFFTKRKEMIFADGEEEFLDKLFIYPIERRGRMIWDQYYEKLNQKEHAERVKALYGEAFFDDQNARHQDEYYSYGELFRVMYVSTRCGIFTRDFIRFLLSAFSFILPPFVENEKIRNDERFSHDDFVKPRNHYEKMVEFYRYSFLGTWWNDLIGMDYDEGMYFRSNAEKMSKQLEEDVFSDCLRLNKSNFFTKSILKKIQEKTIIPFVLMALCMSKFQDYIEAKRIMICQNDSQQVLKYDRMEVKDVIFDMSHKFNMDYEELSDTNYDPESSYDPTAYFMNMMHLEEKNDHFIEFVFTYRFVRSMHRAFDCPINANNAIISKLKKIMEESEFGKFKEIVSSCLQQIINDFRDNHLSNVFKHTDLMYNVIKKHMIAGLYSSSTTPNAKKCIRQNSDWDGTKSIANAIRRVYHDLACEFEKQDEKYFSELKNPKDTDRHPCFSIRLKNSMIYKLFVEGGYDEAMEMGAYFIIEKRKKPNKVALFQQDPQMETLSNVLEKVYEPYTTYRRGITELKSLLNVSLSRYMDNYVTERVADAITLQIVSYSLAWQRVFDSMENNLNTEKQPRDSVAFEMMAMLENKAVRIAEAIKRMVLTGHVPGDDD